tara:strand:+ start:1111 stop:3597 length:2487 start_codon:yes stop_codon:yes gene_type:complete
MAETNPYMFTERFTTATGANFLSALASIERMYRLERQKDDTFRQNYLLQERRLNVEASLWDKRLTAQQTREEGLLQTQITAEATQREADRALKFQEAHIDTLNQLANDQQRLYESELDKLEVQKWSINDLQSLPYQETTSGGKDIMDSIEELRKSRTTLLSKDNLAMTDMLKASEMRRDMTEQQLLMVRNLSETAKEVDFYLSNNTPMWFQDSRQSNPSLNPSEIVALQENYFVDDIEMQELFKRIDVKGTPTQGISTHKGLQLRVANMVRAQTDPEYTKLKSTLEVVDAISLKNQKDFDSSIGNLNGFMEAALEENGAWARSVLKFLPNLKFSDKIQLSDHMSEFVGDVNKRIASAHKKLGPGNETDVGLAVIQAGNDILGVLAQPEVKQIELLSQMVNTINDAIALGGATPSADESAVAVMVFEELQKAGVLNGFIDTEGGEWRRILTDAQKNIDSNNAEILIAHKTKKDLYKMRMDGEITEEEFEEVIKGPKEKTENEAKTTEENKLEHPNGMSILNLETQKVEDRDGNALRDASLLELGETIFLSGTDEQKEKWGEALDEYQSHIMGTAPDINAQIDNMYNLDLPFNEWNYTGGGESSFGIDKSLTLNNILQNKLTGGNEENTILEDDDGNIVQTDQDYIDSLFSSLSNTEEDRLNLSRDRMTQEALDSASGNDEVLASLDYMGNWVFDDYTKGFTIGNFFEEIGGGEPLFLNTATGERRTGLEMTMRMQSGEAGEFANGMDLKKFLDYQTVLKNEWEKDADIRVLTRELEKKRERVNRIEKNMKRTTSSRNKKELERLKEEMRNLAVKIDVSRGTTISETRAF